MKNLEIIPGFLSMYGVFTSQNTSQVRQEMSSRRRSFDKPRSRLHMTITVGGKNQYQIFVIAM